MDYVIVLVSRMVQHKIDNPQDFSPIADRGPNVPRERRAVRHVCVDGVVSRDFLVLH